MSTTTAQIYLASAQVNRYVSVVFLLSGLIGNTLCCIVFFERTLRSNPCVMYFLGASIFNIIALISGIPPRMLSNWNILPDLTETTSLLCKSRLVALFTTRNIASWLLACATIDRYLVSSPNVHIRLLSQQRKALGWIAIVCILSVLFWTETWYCFDANLVGTPIKCYAKSTSCRIFNDLAQSFVTTIIPSIVMLVFGLCMIRNIRRSHRVQPSIATIGPVRRQKSDSALTKMLFLQVILLTVFNLPQAVQKFYLTYTFDQPKSPMQSAIESFVFNIVLLCTYVPNCIPFFLYILTGNLFRRRLIEIFQTMFQYLKCAAR